MKTSITWIVCENSGRWAAGLRVALAREATKDFFSPRIFEVRSSAELLAAMNGRVATFAFVEVRSDNLAQVLELLTAGQRRTARFVALLDESVSRHPVETTIPNSDWEFVTDVLWEAGAADVIASPRQLRVALKLAELHAATCAKLTAPAHDPESFAERAWTSLPWQNG